MLLTSALVREHHAGVAVNPATRACSPVSQGAQAPRFFAAFLCAHVFAPLWAGRAGHIRMRRFLESGLQTRTVPPTLLQGVAVLQSLLKEAFMCQCTTTPALGVDINRPYSLTEDDDTRLRRVRGTMGVLTDLAGAAHKARTLNFTPDEFLDCIASLRDELAAVIESYCPRRTA